MTTDEKIRSLEEHRGSVVALQQEMLDMASKANAEADKMGAFLEAIDYTLDMLRSDLLPL